jgi:hypothetical protein
MTQEATTEENQEATHPVALAWGWPLWLAVTFTVFLSWPLGIVLGDYNIPLYVVFVVWVEYFVFEAKPSALKIMIPNFIYGSVTVSVGTLLFVWVVGLGLISNPEWNIVLALSLAYFPVIGGLVKGMDFYANAHPLPVFNGVAMTLGVFFTKSYWPLTENGYGLVLLALAACVAAGLVGGAAAYFNVAITVPRKEAAQTSG